MCGVEHLAAIAQNPPRGEPHVNVSEGLSPV
jgi:hypothetical protein